MKRQRQHMRNMVISDILACVFHKCDFRHIQRALIILREKAPVTAYLWMLTFGSVCATIRIHLSSQCQLLPNSPLASVH